MHHSFSTGSKWQYAVLPLNPTKDVFEVSALGTTGFVETGGVIYNHLAGRDGELAVFYELDTLDNCYGHSDKQKQYHYHGVRKS